MTGDLLIKILFSSTPLWIAYFMVVALLVFLIRIFK